MRRSSERCRSCGHASDDPDGRLRRTGARACCSDDKIRRHVGGVSAVTVLTPFVAGGIDAPEVAVSLEPLSELVTLPAIAERRWRGGDPATALGQPPERREPSSHSRLAHRSRNGAKNGAGREPDLTLGAHEVDIQRTRGNNARHTRAIASGSKTVVDSNADGGDSAHGTADGRLRSANRPSRAAGHGLAKRRATRDHTMRPEAPAPPLFAPLPFLRYPSAVTTDADANSAGAVR